MQPLFNINRPPVSDEEIEKHKDFDRLVAQFKKQSLKKARGDESWWKNKKIQYSTIILGVTVVCTVTYQSIKSQDKTLAAKPKNETISTPQEVATKKYKPATYVQPKIASLDKKTTSYSVNNQQGAVIKHSSSSKITVPKNAFVDKSGKEIVGDIQLEYREFDNLADIIACGIPMRHDSAGKPFLLESAGMFELRGSNLGAPVFIKSGTPLSVELASYNADKRFHQYYLDTAARNWRFLGPDNSVSLQDPSPQINNQQQLAVLNKEIKETLPQQAINLQQKIEVVQKQKPDINVPKLPAKVKDEGRTFKLDGSFKEFPELAAFKNVLFEVGPENKNYSPRIHDITWGSFKITEGPVKGKNYLLHLSTRGHNETLIVYPVLAEGDYEQATEKYEAEMAHYSRLLKETELKKEKELAALRLEREKIENEIRKKQDERRRLQAAAENHSLNGTEGFNRLSGTEKARRLFQVNRFGIYNSDCPHLAEGAETIVPGFVEKKSGKVIRPEAVYLVDHSIKSVALSVPADPRLYILKGNNYNLCIVDRGRIYVCDKTTFNEQLTNGNKVFPVLERPEASNDIASLHEALEL